MIKNFDNDDRWSNFTFQQINQLKSFPPEKLNQFLNLNGIIYTANDMREIKKHLLVSLSDERSEEKYFTQLVTLLNSDKTKKFLQFLLKFVNECQDYSDEFLVGKITPLIAKKIKLGDTKILERMDFSKLTVRNFYNFIDLTDKDAELFYSFDVLYEIAPLLKNELIEIENLFSLYPDKDISKIVVLFYENENTNGFVDSLKNLYNLTKNYNIDITLFSDYSYEKMAEISKKSAIEIKCILKDIDYDYIIKNYPNSVLYFSRLINNDVDIKDIYKNGYPEYVIRNIMQLRYQNLKTYESVLLGFIKEKNTEEDVNLFTKFLSLSVPNNETILLFKDYLNKNDKKTTRSLLNTIDLMNKNSGISDITKLFKIGDNIKLIEQFYQTFYSKKDLTTFPIEEVSEKYLKNALKAYNDGFDFEQIFDEKFKKYDNLLYEALYINEINGTIPNTQSDILKVYKSLSNKEYESLWRLYNKNVVNLTGEEANKLEYLIKYNKTHKSILIENYFKQNLSSIKEQLEGEDYDRF